MERSNARDFYTDEVLPALQQTLDTAFPEFGWRRDRHGWVATNQEFTHRALGVRADRLVAHGPAPRGFLVHGADAVLWTAYLNGGVTPRGRDFVIAVRELAGPAGVDAAPLDRPQPRDRRAELLQDVFLVARREKIADSLIGVMPECRQLADALARAGYARSEIQSSGVLADSRWQGESSAAGATKAATREPCGREPRTTAITPTPSTCTCAARPAVAFHRTGSRRCSPVRSTVAARSSSSKA